MQSIPRVDPLRPVVNGRYGDPNQALGIDPTVDRRGSIMDAGGIHNSIIDHAWRNSGAPRVYNSLNSIPHFIRNRVHRRGLFLTLRVGGAANRPRDAIRVQIAPPALCSTESASEYRRITNLLNLRAISCEPSRRYNRRRRVDDRCSQPTFARKRPALAHVFAGGLRQHNDQDGVGSVDLIPFRSDLFPIVPPHSGGFF